ncbi:MAG: hypothetical protein ACRDPC_01460 [Solirubrobacteraceae bacterium]
MLSSRLHLHWALRHSSTLEDRPRYTPTSAFATFPWPQPSADRRERIGSLAAELIERRQQICVERGIGLTALYNQVDDGAWEDLVRLHAQLDAAVAGAYGWPREAAAVPLDGNARLAALNTRIARGETMYAPF